MQKVSTIKINLFVKGFQGVPIEVACFKLIFYFGICGQSWISDNLHSLDYRYEIMRERKSTEDLTR